MANTKWVVDAAHSSIDFSVKHMMVAKTKGTFQKFDAAVEADPADLTQYNEGNDQISLFHDDSCTSLSQAGLFQTMRFIII